MHTGWWSNTWHSWLALHGLNSMVSQGLAHIALIHAFCLGQSSLESQVSSLVVLNKYV